MSLLTIGRGAVVLGLALGPGAAGVAAPVLPREAATTQAAVLDSVVEMRVRVPLGILSSVPSGGDPYIASRPRVYPVPAAWPPWVGGRPPAFVPRDVGPCFVRGYYGSCRASHFWQYLNRPD
jgi:hypothetical protein